MNGARLGLHGTLKEQLFGATPGQSFLFLRNLCAGAMAGMIGAFVASPLYLIKVRPPCTSLSSSRNLFFHY